MPTTVSLTDAAAAIDTVSAVLDRAAAHLRDHGGVDAHQLVAYDLAHGASALRIARTVLDYGAKGDTEQRIALAFLGEALGDLVARVAGRESAWGVGAHALDGIRNVLAATRDVEALAALAQTPGKDHLDDDFAMVRDVFRSFAEDKVRPVAEHVHRTNADIPEDIISGLAELGAFGLSVPEEHGGSATGAESDYLGMLIATEELSRGSLGVGGSLITRPEIAARALVDGATDEQRAHWLPRIADGEVMCAIAVTEPDFGSDVAGLKVTATRTDDGWLLNGVKTWCTFAGRADVLVVLARTDPDRSKGHKGLSLLLVPKERATGDEFAFTQDGGGRLAGRAIDTLGYRGMHSFEVTFENWLVPADHLVGGVDGEGRGFYLQMAGFESGRLQTAARAVGLMQASYEAAREYAAARHVFGQALADYQLTQVKLGRMVVVIQACRQFMYDVARRMAKGEGTLEAAMVKAYACRAAEVVAREAQQIHGGMGYAEEFPVSRYFVDARVLSIFEGADETLALKIIARRLLAEAAS